jgi:hypothetical protein
MATWMQECTAASKPPVAETRRHHSITCQSTQPTGNSIYGHPDDVAKLFPYTPNTHSIHLPNLEVLHIATTHDAVAAIAVLKLTILCLRTQTHGLRRNDAKEIHILDGHEQMVSSENLNPVSACHVKHFSSDPSQLWLRR